MFYCTDSLFNENSIFTPVNTAVVGSRSVDGTSTVTRAMEKAIETRGSGRTGVHHHPTHQCRRTEERHLSSSSWVMVERERK
jgi:hypothetical protein